MVRMLASGKKKVSIILSSFATLILLSPSLGSSLDPSEAVQSQKTSQSHTLKLTHQLSFQITLHAFLLWASVGFLMPVGILIIRMSQRVECGRRLKTLYCCHVVLQITSVLLATAGAVLSIKNFENSFSNTHQRIGLALYALILIQPLIGFCRPHRGVKVRSIWYFVHWFLGTGISIIGIMNIYIGLHAYHKKTSRSVRIWSALFTVEVVLIAFIYLFQDRWDHMKKQGVIMGDEQITPTDHTTPPRNNQKQLSVLFKSIS